MFDFKKKREQKRERERRYNACMASRPRKKHPHTTYRDMGNGLTRVRRKVRNFYSFSFIPTSVRP